MSLPARDAQTATICRYYDGCTAGDLAILEETLHPDVIHYFLAPNIGSAPVGPREHLARYWRKVTAMIDARWVVDRAVTMGDETVIEWTMFWRPEPTADRVATRGAEWFVFEGGLIREIRSYYQQKPFTTGLEGFDYAARGYAVAGREASALHPEAAELRAPARPAVTEQTVLIEVTDRIATVTLNRPAQLNALNEPMRLAVADALAALTGDDGVAALILTGAGRAFCVGQDLSAESELADCEDCVRRTYNPVVERLAGMGKPVIAAVNGPAVGAGMGLALACDMVLMGDDAFLSCAFGKVGLSPDSGTTFFLARTLGHRRAFELAATGRRVPAAEAVALGLANRVVASAALPKEARAAAIDLAGAAGQALAVTKRLLRAAHHLSLADALSAEALAQGVLGHSTDHLDRRTAFLSKATR